MSKVIKITDEQWAMIEKLRQEVIDSLTDQPSDERVRAAVLDLWKAMGNDPVATLIADGPMTAAATLVRLLALYGKQRIVPQSLLLDAKMVDAVWSRELEDAQEMPLPPVVAVGSEAEAQTTLQGLLQHYSLERLAGELVEIAQAGVNAGVGGVTASVKAFEDLYATPDDETRRRNAAVAVVQAEEAGKLPAIAHAETAAVLPPCDMLQTMAYAMANKAGVARDVMRRLFARLDPAAVKAETAKIYQDLLKKAREQFYVSVWWRSWSGWYQGAKMLGVEFPEDVYNRFLNYTVCVPVIYANASVPVVARWPKEIHWKDGRLHNETGPSILFRDGWKLWTLEGFPVDEQIVMRPETQTVEQIEKEQNDDVRSIRIDRFGWPRYLKETGAQLVDHRENEVEGCYEALYRQGNGNLRFLVTCPTARIFSKGIEPDAGVETCAQAQDWLAGGKNFNVIART